MRNEGRKINDVEVPVPGPPAGWNPPPEPTPEKLREDALVHLSRIDSRRATESLIRDGWDDERIAALQDVHVGNVKAVRERMKAEGTACPVTPKELGWRRAAGQISDQEMMERLRSWPYTFSRLVVDAIDYGDWDDVIWLRNNFYISREEFGELKSITDKMPRRTDVF